MIIDLHLFNLTCLHMVNVIELSERWFIISQPHVVNRLYCVEDQRQKHIFPLGSLCPYPTIVNGGYRLRAWGEEQRRHLLVLKRAGSDHNVGYMLAACLS